MTGMRMMWVFSLCILAFGCTTVEKRKIIITGISNDPEVKLATLEFGDSTHVDTIDNGLFWFELSEIEEGYAGLSLNNGVPLFVGPGDSLFIEYNNPNQVSISGTGFEESRYLQSKKALVNELGFDDPRKIDIALFSAEPTAFISKIDSISQVRINHLDNYKNQNAGLSGKFYNLESQLIQYFRVNQLFTYPGFHEMLTNNKPVLPGDYYKFVGQIEPNQKELFDFSDYKNSLVSFLDFRAKEANPLTPGDLLKEKYTISKEFFTEKKIFEGILFKEFNNYINFNGIDGIDSIFKSFIQTVTDKEKIDYLTKKYDSWSHLSRGNKAPEFEIEDENGKVVKLSDFQGKLVYIDCWSSFCGPCIAEMPAMKKLSDDFNGKNIVFVSVSVDSDKDRWLNSLQKFELNTVNLCTGGTEHPFNTSYNAKAFPRYILIDSKGLIIDATAGKPSAIKEQLEQLL